MKPTASFIHPVDRHYFPKLLHPYEALQSKRQVLASAPYDRRLCLSSLEDISGVVAPKTNSYPNYIYEANYADAKKLENSSPTQQY